MARPSVVLLPGLACDCTVWAAQEDSFARDVDVLAYPHFDGHRTLATMADAVLQAAPPRFALAGHSMGARVALTIMAKAPERVERLALLDVGVTPAAPAESARRQVLIDVVKAEGMAGLARAWIPDIVHADRLCDSDLMARLKAMICRPTPETYYGQVTALLARPDFRPLLPKIACPTLVLCGDDDKLSSAGAHREIAAAIPGARLVVVGACGHMATMEKPEAVTAALRDWLGSGPHGSAGSP